MNLLGPELVRDLVSLIQRVEADDTRDDVLDNATRFWLTNTTISAARLYREALDKKTNFFGPKNVGGC
jgi:hypothetical protein